MLRVEQVSKTYVTQFEKVKALQNCNIAFPNKGLITILGKSGSGKSTLLHLLASMDMPSEGQIFYNGVDINAKEFDQEEYKKEKIGLVFQDFHLIEELTVYENIKISLQLKKDEQTIKVDHILTKMNIEDIKKHKINEISTGQKARTAISRALVKNPKIILADEPTGNLDEKTSEEIWKILKKESKQRLVIIATHDIESAQKYSDKMIKIQDGSCESFSNCVYENVEKEAKTTSFNIKDFLTKVLHLPLKFTILFYTILGIALFLLLITLNLNAIDINEIHAKALIENDAFKITLYKKESDSMYAQFFNKKEENRIKKNLNNSSIYYGSNLYINNEYFYFSFLNTNDITDYYKLYNYDKREADLFIDANYLEYEYIGNIPTKSKEIMISNFLADYIIRMKVTDEFNKVISAKTREELLDETIKMMGISLKIVGIYKTTELKDKEFLNKEEENVIKKHLYTYYVDENFFKDETLPKNKDTINTMNLLIDTEKVMYTSDHTLDKNSIILSEKYKEKYLKQKNIELQIEDKYNLYEDLPSKIDLKIAGFGDTIYLNDTLFDGFEVDHQFIKNMYYKDNDKNTIKKLFALENEDIGYFTEFSDDFFLIKNTMQSITKICFIGCIILSIFTFLFMILFINYTFMKNKKKIGILLSLGVNRKEIYKGVESKNIILGIISYIISMLLYVLMILLGNKMISNYLGYQIQFIPMKIYILSIALLMILLLIIIANKIEKRKIEKCTIVELCK